MANVKATDLIEYTRASKGHALAKISYGSNQLPSASFSTVLTGTWDGTEFVDTVGSQTRPGITSNTSLTNGTTYALFINITDITGATQVRIDGLDGTDRLLGEGDHRVSFISNGGTPRVRLEDTSTSVNDGFTLQSALEAKEVLFNQADGTLQLFEHLNNIPRIEYDADGNLLGLLIEEQRTNTIQYSEDFENSYWGKSGGFSIYGNNGIAPDGTRTATLITDADEDSYMVKSGYIASNGQTKSIWARTVSGTGKVTLLKHNSVSAALFDLTEEWQRFELPVDTSEIGGANVYAIDFRAAGATLTEAYIWGAQLETGAFATSYIKTTGSTASRSADVASIDVDQFGYNQSAGTVFVEAQGNGDPSLFRRFLNFEESSSKRWEIIGDTGEDVRMFAASGSGADVNADVLTNVLDGTTMFKMAFAKAENDAAASGDGGVVVTDTANGQISGVVNLYIGSGSGGASDFVCGHIKSIKYFPKRLSNAKLQELTS